MLPYSMHDFFFFFPYSTKFYYRRNELTSVFRYYAQHRRFYRSKKKEHEKVKKIADRLMSYCDVMRDVSLFCASSGAWCVD
uniref:MADS-box domain-containing protein n=1 Tax=Ascaris lumbricoides TaxID=6252 RepID=A0A0M3IV37_ASCLU